MSAYPAEHYAKLYMRQAWGGKAAVPYKTLLGQINAELHKPMERCPQCEEPGYPTLLEWPERSQRWESRLRQRVILCVNCGYRVRLGYPCKHPENHQVQIPVQEVIRLYNEGMTSPELGRKYFCSASTILGILHRNGVEVRPHGGSKPLRSVSLDQMYRIHQMVTRDGLSQMEIARRLGVKQSTLANWIKRMREAGWFPERRFLQQQQKERRAA